MFAFRHKENKSFLYVTCVTDSWGNNPLTTLIQEQDLKDHTCEGASIYVQPTHDALVKVYNLYIDVQITHEEFAGSFHEPVSYIPLEEYEIVELNVIMGE